MCWPVLSAADHSVCDRLVSQRGDRVVGDMRDEHRVDRVQCQAATSNEAVDHQCWQQSKMGKMQMSEQVWRMMVLFACSIEQ